MLTYRGRFAPTPSGPLHAGSIVAALASWLDARAHGGQWLVRIEDTDTPRCVDGAAEYILHQLHRLGMRPDEPVQWQSQRSSHYEQALQRLQTAGHVYGCACSRQDIETARAAQGAPRLRHAAAAYPGTCRSGTQGRAVRAWRVRLGEADALRCGRWQDRRLGMQTQDLQADVGDFVIRRADGWWAYQLAVVVDDALQGITDVVRGEDLADNTPRQMLLQGLLGAPTPRYLHTALVRAADGQKLSKQTGAQAVDVGDPLRVLQEAAQVLELSSDARLAQAQAQVQPKADQPSSTAMTSDAAVQAWLEQATAAWAQRWRREASSERT